MRRLVATVGLVLLVAASPACSLRQDEQPREIPNASLPEVLFKASADNRGGGNESRIIYLVRTIGTAEQLVSVRVPIQPPANRADFPKAIIEKLVSNPTIADKSEYASVIPLGTRVLAVAQHDDVLDVDLSKELGSVDNQRQRLAVAQIVFTATAIEGIYAVRFFIDGNPSAVPLDDRTSEVGALISRDDFPRLRPGAATTTTMPPPTVTEVDPATDPTLDPVAPDPTTADPASATPPVTDAPSG